MHECNAMQNLKKNNKKKIIFGHKGLRVKAQGPCQRDSPRLSLLCPHSFRCKLRVGVSRKIILMFNSNIGINVKSLYQFMNKCYTIMCFWHKHFLFSCFLRGFQLETIWVCMPSSSMKMTKPLRFMLFLTLSLIRILGFWLTKIYHNLPSSKNFFWHPNI